MDRCDADSFWWGQRGTCLGCHQQWVLGKSISSAGLYGQFYCGACWDSGSLPYQDAQGTCITANMEPAMKFNTHSSHEISPVRVGYPHRDRVVNVAKGYRNDLYGPCTGFSLWLGSQVLLDYMESMESKLEVPLKGSRIIELGAGMGLLGLGLAQCGANVVLTDVPRITPLLELNMAMNFHNPYDNPQQAETLSCCPRVQVLRWGSRRDIQRILNTTTPIDYVIGSEIVYDPSVHHSLLLTLHGLVFAHRAPCRSKRKGLTLEAGRGKKWQALQKDHRLPQVILAMARRPNEFETFAYHVAQHNWSLRVLHEVDLRKLTGLPSCSDVVVVELKPPTKCTPMNCQRNVRQRGQAQHKGDQ